MHCRGIKTQIKGILKTKETKMYSVCCWNQGIYKQYCLCDGEYTNVYKKNNKTVIFDSRYEASVACKALNEKITRKRPTIGTELEFEIGSGDDETLVIQDLKRAKPPLCATIKYDGSLANGFELNTSYMPIKGWELKKIREMMECIKEYEPNNKRNTAGQHVHIFGPDNSKVLKLINNNYQKFLEFIEPICARDKYVRDSNGNIRCNKYFGLKRDAFRSNGCYTTLEIRAFAASPDPQVIKDRLVVCDALYKTLARYGTWRNIYKRLTKKGQKAYKRLLRNKENPHCFGADIPTMLAKFN